MKKTTIATGAVAVVLGLAVTGAAALAAFQPPAEQALVAATDGGPTAALTAEDRPVKDGMKAILDRLVANGTITQAQEDAIIAAFRQASQHEAILKRVLGGMLKLSVEYIGLPQESVAGQLKAGKSLGEIADTRPGKSRDGLIAYLTTALTAQIDKLVADGKITQERANEVKAHLTERVTKFVDHKVERKPQTQERKPQTQERKPADRSTKRPAVSPSPKPTT